MKTSFKPFDINCDFIRVRDFLSKTYSHYQRPVNWRIERWEYAFYFIAPFLGNWDEQPPLMETAQAAIQYLEKMTGLWETAQGKVAGLVTIEHPDLTHPGFGEFFIQRHPEHLDLLPEMLDFAKANLRDPGQNRLFTYIEPDEQPLSQLLRDRGFIPDPEDRATESILTLNHAQLPERKSLPNGFGLRSMADDNDLAKRCKAFGLAFDHPDPIEWPSLISYESLQQAPDYHKDQDIVVVAPDGEFAAFCLIWYDEKNKLASLEPVGTQPPYRRMGLAREAVLEAIRRVTAKGAQQVAVGSDQAFYTQLGFKPSVNRIRYQKNFT